MLSYGAWPVAKNGSAAAINLFGKTGDELIFVDAN